MVDLRSKIFGLAGALLCTGMAYAAPATCTAPTTTTVVIRAEGTTEQLAPVTWTCTITAGAATPSGAGIAIQDFLSPAIPATSKLLSSTTGATEATIVITCTTCAVAPTGTSTISGVISGSTINFNGTLPGLTPSAAVPPVTPPYATGDVLTFVMTNVRVNATSLSVGSGLPPSISETIFVSGAAVVPAALAAVTAGFAQNGLGASTLNKSFTIAGAGFPFGTTGAFSGANSFVICNTYRPSFGNALATVVTVKENFSSAFKTAGAAGASLPGNEASQTVAPISTNTTPSGTRVSVNFANVPANVTVYVPSAAILSQGLSTASISLTSAGAGSAFAAVSAGTSSTLAGLALAAVTIASGTGTATFEVLVSDPTNLDTFNIPVYIVTTANTVPGSATAMTINVSLAPVGSTAIPNFAVGANTTTLTASAFSLCTTSLMFPFVTNQLGFDTGIAVANTSTDPFGGLGATPQAGTCSLNFYGNGAPTPNNVTTPNVPSGTVYTTTLSSVAAGFQGYVIAQCQFQYAHAFVFVTNGVGPNGGLSQGYLAGIILDTNQVGRPAGAAGTGETLGQ